MSLIVSLLASVLTTQSWTPPDTWAFTPEEDQFSSTALLDLRSLNEKIAGESGFVKVDGEGGFQLGNSKPVRFWCINTTVGREKPWTARPMWSQKEPSLAAHARFMAKRGVNMVRLHAHLNPSADMPLNSIRESERDWIWRTVAAMKKEGIYTTISPYWAIEAKIGKDWGIAASGLPNAAALLFFEPKLQAAYKGWLKQLFSPKNPYTGLSLAQDAGVGIIQIQNEDSLLFWTISGLQGDARELMKRQFGTWLKSKYGSMAAVQQRWQNVSQKGDNLAAGLPELVGIWEFTQARQGGMQQRIADQLEFWTETMYRFNSDIVKYLREDLGGKQLINAGNWRTADSLRLFDAERYSYTPTEVDAVNRYFSGIHKGPNTGWAIVNGDRFTSPSVLRDPSAFPLTIKQTFNRPMLITESTWVSPMAYTAEAPFLVSAYQSLTGIAGYYWFATGDEGWIPPQSGNGYLDSLGMWVFGNPEILGSFPGAAMMYRMGYIEKGKNAVEEHRSLSDIWQRKLPIIAEESGFDPNRDTGDIVSKSSVKTFINPKAFLVGPVTVAFDDAPEKTRAQPLSSFIQGTTVQSNTNQIALDSSKEFCTLDTPCAQGVTAFFAQKPTYKLSSVTLRSGNEYGAALVVSMDGKPLDSSSKVLVQFATRSRPTGWVDQPTDIKLDGGATVKGSTIVSIGKKPWQVQKADLTVVIQNPNLKTARVLDMNGMQISTIPVTKTSKSVQFDFPKTAMYVVLQ